MGSIKCYVDTHIFIDYYLDRKNHFRPLGEFAFNFIRNAASCKYHVLISSFNLIELSDNLKMSEQDLWEKVLNLLYEAGKITVVEVSDAQRAESRKISKERKIAIADALFAILARDNNAILISRDIHHDEVKDFVEVKKPEELD